MENKETPSEKQIENKELNTEKTRNDIRTTIHETRKHFWKQKNKLNQQENRERINERKRANYLKKKEQNAIA